MSSQQFVLKEGPTLNKINQMSDQKMSTTERDNLTGSEKTTGMKIYNTTTAVDEYWTGSVWKLWGE